MVNYHQFGEDNPNWLGDNISIRGLHKRIYRERGAPSGECVYCTKPAVEWAWDREGDKYDVYSYEESCHSCNIKGDMNEQWISKATAHTSYDKSHRFC